MKNDKTLETNSNVIYNIKSLKLSLNWLFYRMTRKLKNNTMIGCMTFRQQSFCLQTSHLQSDISSIEDRVFIGRMAFHLQSFCLQTCHLQSHISSIEDRVFIGCMPFRQLSFCLWTFHLQSDISSIEHSFHRHHDISSTVIFFKWVSLKLTHICVVQYWCIPTRSLVFIHKRIYKRWLDGKV